MKTTIKFPKSDSFAFFVTINKIAKALDNAFFTVKENPDEEPVLQKKLGAGISLADSRLYKNQLSYKVQIDGADTQFMEVGVRYFFDVKGTIGNAQKTFLWGELILSDTETGYLNPAMQGDTVAVAQVYTATFETGAQSEYVETEVDPVATAKIGDMTKLNTTAKDTLVKAINEVNAPTFTEATTRENIVSGEKQSTLWGKTKKWFSSLKTLAFKDKVEAADISDGALIAIGKKLYPIGSIKITTENTNPSTYLGGTWIAWGAGRVPVGVDASDADFATVEKTGGEKNTTLSLNNLPEHEHTLGVNKPDAGRRLITTWISNLNATTFSGWEYSATPSESSTILTRSYGSTTYESAKTGKAGWSPEVISPVANLQPYITCYMWKRTA